MDILFRLALLVFGLIDHVEIIGYHPRTLTLSSNFSQLVQEFNLLSLILWTINIGKPPCRLKSNVDAQSSGLKRKHPYARLPGQLLGCLELEEK
jgi:hypothetical protein